MQGALDSFIQYLRTEKRYSDHTLVSYNNDLNQFFAYCEDEYEISKVSEVSHPIIRSWIVSLMDSEYSTRSIKRKSSSVKSLFKFLKREGLVKENPSAQLVTPKTNKRLPQFVEDRNMQKLFAELEFGEDFKGQRDLLLIKLFYETGMRLAELIGLKDSDVQFDRAELRVLGKRNKERIIPLGQDLLLSIQNMLVIKREMGFNNEALILTDKGKKLYPKFVYRKINGYLSTVTNMQKKSPHVLRHTFATHMLNNGAELNAIKEILGHSSLAATQVYTHNTIDQLKDIYKNTHPRG